MLLGGTTMPGESTGFVAPELRVDHDAEVGEHSIIDEDFLTRRPKID
jgi:hypothetical protein